jgi:hypothetical protein
MLDDPAENSFEHGVSLIRARRFAEAADIFRRLAKTTLTVNLALNLGICLAEIGDRAGAEHYLALAAGARPNDVNIRRLLGVAYGESGRIDLAERELLAARAAKPGDPDTELALAGFYLSLGRFAEGWPLMAARAALHPDLVPPVSTRFPEWRGEPLAGKSVLVWVEQGFGDQIQMARFAVLLKTRGAARVSLACRPQLAHLFSTLAGIDTVISVAPRTTVTVGQHDYWSRYFSLPAPLGITLQNLPTAPYLSAPADRRERWQSTPDGVRIGLVWQASPTGFNAANKSLPPDLAQRLLDAGAVSLQPEDTGAQDFAETAAIIENLSLVISIDTSVAHLAGAMGKPVWTLLPYIRCDWRWLRDRADSPWYPTMKLYRQALPGHWSGTVDQVLDDLAASGLAAS